MCQWQPLCHRHHHYRQSITPSVQPPLSQSPCRNLVLLWWLSPLRSIEAASDLSCGQLGGLRLRHRSLHVLAAITASHAASIRRTISLRCSSPSCTLFSILDSVAWSHHCTLTGKHVRAWSCCAYVYYSIFKEQQDAMHRGLSSHKKLVCLTALAAAVAAAELS